MEDNQHSIVIASERLSDREASERLEIYKMLVEMADRVSQRRQEANGFYLSINTLLVGGSAYLGTIASTGRSVTLISVAGFAICFLWVWNIGSYKTLNAAKFAIITDVETRMVEQPFAAEWEKLDPDKDGKRHRPFHKVEVLVPWVFTSVYAIQILSEVPWAKLINCLTQTG
ncbi:MAG: hypothetical protein M9945_08945 [Aquamicrobium sp.]|uniref:RipA family octameric membrane protein n=1 Tax=Aquamicrobium sp. TaxID=1872579 RepID=UPI00349EAC4F|nr:hypothetical protein [Aquamicrobium sp.]